MFLKEFFEKVDFEKSQLATTKAKKNTQHTKSKDIKMNLCNLF